MNINNILIVGGTHGNELTGVFLLDHWQKDNRDFANHSFSIEFLLANPMAVDMGKRYVDNDLNRRFLRNSSYDLQSESHEDALAKNIYQKYGPDSGSEFDFIIDMHTSTSNMGITLMIESNRINLQIADYVRKRVPESHIYCFKKSDRTQSCLRSMSPFAIGLEVGPVAHNQFCHKTIQKMRLAVLSIFEGIAAVDPSANNHDSCRKAEIYAHIGDVPYPIDSYGSRLLIHEMLEEKNYLPLHQGDPLFVSLEGEIVNYVQRQL